MHYISAILTQNSQLKVNGFVLQNLLQKDVKIHMPLAHMVTNHVNHVVLMHDVLSPGITTYKDIPSTSIACQVSTNVKMYVKSDNFPTDSTSICNISLKSNPNAKLFER